MVAIVASDWGVELYEDEHQASPVQNFMNDLDPRRRAKLLAIVRLLEEQGPALGFPYSSQVRGRLRELRTRMGREHYRVLYFGSPKRTFVLLHALSKRSAKIPQRDIDVAEQRMKRYLGEM